MGEESYPWLQPFLPKSWKPALLAATGTRVSLASNPSNPSLENASSMLVLPEREALFQLGKCVQQGAQITDGPLLPNQWRAWILPSTVHVWCRNSSYNLFGAFISSQQTNK